MVQVLPSGAIAHFSASSGMYAPVCRSMPTRNSRAGLLSRLALRGLSQVKLVSHPVGATAILSRSSFAACAGGARHSQATVTTTPMTHSAPTTDPLHSNLCIHNLLRCLLCMRVREVVLALLLESLDAVSAGIRRMPLSGQAPPVRVPDVSARYLHGFSCVHAEMRNVWPMSPPSQPAKGQSSIILGSTTTSMNRSKSGMVSNCSNL